MYWSVMCLWLITCAAVVWNGLFLSLSVYYTYTCQTCVYVQPTLGCRIDNLLLHLLSVSIQIYTLTIYMYKLKTPMHYHITTTKLASKYKKAAVRPKLIVTVILSVVPEFAIEHAREGCTKAHIAKWMSQTSKINLFIAQFGIMQRLLKMMKGHSFMKGSWDLKVLSFQMKLKLWDFTAYTWIYNYIGAHSVIR